MLHIEPHFDVSAGPYRSGLAVRTAVDIMKYAGHLGVEGLEAFKVKVETPLEEMEVDGHLLSVPEGLKDYLTSAETQTPEVQLARYCAFRPTVYAKRYSDQAAQFAQSDMIDVLTSLIRHERLRSIGMRVDDQIITIGVGPPDGAAEMCCYQGAMVDISDEISIGTSAK